jgi:hypothetical protein
VAASSGKEQGRLARLRSNNITGRGKIYVDDDRSGSSSELEISDEGKTETVKEMRANSREESIEYAVCTRWVLFVRIN